MIRYTTAGMQEKNKILSGENKPYRTQKKENETVIRRYEKESRTGTGTFK